MKSVLEYRGYHARIEFDAEDQLIVGEVLGISDSLSFHGESVSEITAMFHQSVDNYLELCAACGKDPEREYKGTFNVRISSELHRRAALCAAENGQTLNQLVGDAIDRYLSGGNTEAIDSCVIIRYPAQTLLCGALDRSNQPEQYESAAFSVRTSQISEVATNVKQ
jgi:predicted HicB family RNase H-like nuclease